MPLFTFICGEGHSTERLAHRDTEVIWCSCGQPAARQSIYSVATLGFTRTPLDQRRVKLGAFKEASAEVDYAESKRTDIEGKPLPQDALWPAARREAKRLAGLGIKDSGDL